VPADISDYAGKDWEQHIAKLRTVVSVSGTNLAPRETVIGISLNGAARAFPLEKILAASPVEDSVGGQPVLLVAGPDGKSVRAFLSVLPGSSQPTQFFKTNSARWELIDSVSADHWNFQGCAVSGSSAGQCLTQLQYLKDYWFDWHNYHPDSTVYSR
jgi:hypothetical protein